MYLSLLFILGDCTRTDRSIAQYLQPMEMEVTPSQFTESMSHFNASIWNDELALSFIRILELLMNRCVPFVPLFSIALLVFGSLCGSLYSEKTSIARHENQEGLYPYASMGMFEIDVWELRRLIDL